MSARGFRRRRGGSGSCTPRHLHLLGSLSNLPAYPTTGLTMNCTCQAAAEMNGTLGFAESDQDQQQKPDEKGCERHLISFPG